MTIDSYLDDNNDKKTLQKVHTCVKWTGKKFFCLKGFHLTR